MIPFFNSFSEVKNQEIIKETLKGKYLEDEKSDVLKDQKDNSSLSEKILFDELKKKINFEKIIINLKTEISQQCIVENLEDNSQSSSEEFDEEANIEERKSIKHILNNFKGMIAIHNNHLKIRPRTSNINQPKYKDQNLNSISNNSSQRINTKQKKKEKHHNRYSYVSTKQYTNTQFVNSNKNVILNIDHPFDDNYLSNFVKTPIPDSNQNPTMIIIKEFGYESPFIISSISNPKVFKLNSNNKSRHYEEILNNVNQSYIKSKKNSQEVKHSLFRSIDNTEDYKANSSLPGDQSNIKNQKYNINPSKYYKNKYCFHKSYDLSTSNHISNFKSVDVGKDNRSSNISSY